MEDRHRNIIQKNYKTLVDNVNINELVPLLIEKGVFSRDQAEHYMDYAKGEKERKRVLFMDIQRRGPKAFNNLINSLLEIDHSHKILAYKLEGKEVPIDEEHQNNNYEKTENHTNENRFTYDNDDNHRGAWAFKLCEDQRPPHIRQLSYEIPHSNINLLAEPLVVKVKKSIKFYDDRSTTKVPIYRMRSKHRGMFLCINNIEFANGVKDRRTGAEVDEENLKVLFKQIGFSVHSHRNQSIRDMKQTIDHFVDDRKNAMLRRTDCVVVAVMSHGEEGSTKESSQIVTSDIKYLSVAWILEQFNSRNCPALINKPKIFIFQICRGDNLHVGVKVQRPAYQRVQSDGCSVDQIVRDAEDMLIAFSTLPGDKSYRDTYLGTWYMQAICKIFMEHAHDTDIENLLKMVDAELKDLRSSDGNMQTSSYENRGFKICYLNPGINDDEKKPIMENV